MSKTEKFTKGYSLVERGTKYYVMFRDSDGIQHCKSTKVPILNENGKPGKQYMKAEQAAIKIISEIEESPNKGRSTKFKRLAEDWLRTYAKDCTRESTLITYRLNVRDHIIPYFQDKNPAEITPYDIKEFLAQKAQSGNMRFEGYGLSKEYVAKLKNILTLIFDCAVDKRLIKVNPARGVSMPKTYNVRPVPKRGVITPEQCNELLSMIEETNKPLYRMIKFAFITAVREGELMGLKWDNVHLDAEKPYIYITTIRSYISGHEVRADVPKTKSSQNNIYINDTIKEMLEEMKAEQRDDELELGAEYDNSDNYVFVKKDGRPYRADHLSKKLAYFCKTHPQFPRLSAHSLRTSCATWLVNEKGWTPLEAAAHLRHKNDDITKQYYIKIDTEDYRQKIGDKSSCLEF